MSELIVEPNVRIFAICAGILVIKMILTGTATGLLRMLRGAYATPEDYALLGKPPGPPDPQVERLRRAHLNDLENILPFLGIGFLFAQSGASYTVAWWLFVVFTTARILHTLCYVAGLQPWRSIVFEVGNVSLAVIAVLLLVNLL